MRKATKMKRQRRDVSKFSEGNKIPARKPLDERQQAFVQGMVDSTRRDAIVQAAQERIELGYQFAEVLHEIERADCLVVAADELIDLGAAFDPTTARRVSGLVDWSKQALVTAIEKARAFARALKPGSGAQS